MSYEIPSDERDIRLVRKEIAQNRDRIRFSPTYSTQVDSSGFGAGSHDYATGVRIGNFVLNPEDHIVSIQLSWTGASGTLSIGDIISTTATAWKGKLLHLVSGDSTAGTGIFEPQNTTAFTDVAQTLSLDTTWTGATYTVGTSKDGAIVTQSASIIVNTIDSTNPTINTIFGAKNDGQFTTIKPKSGLSLSIESGGNFDTSSTITVGNNEFNTIQFFEDNINADTDGSWTLSSSVTGSTSLPVDDTTSIVQDPTDNTKLLRFDVGGNTTGIEGILVTAFTTAKTITFPDATATVFVTPAVEDLDMASNDIVDVGDITPITSLTDIGSSTSPFLRMFSNWFIPDTATIITSRYGLAKTGNTLYVNFDDTNADAGFGIYEQGLQRFLFQQTGTTPFVTTFTIGGDPFLSGEEYRIQMGENSTSSARIFFIQGTGTDLILDRAGGGTDQGVQVRVNAISSQRWLSDQTKFFSDLNVNAQDMINVVNIISNGGGSATTGVIGELITSNGGFNYFMRDTLAWESDSDVKMTMAAGTLNIQTNDSNGVFVGSFGVIIGATLTNDDVFLTSDRSVLVQSNSTGQVGFFSSFGTTKQTITSDTLANLYTVLRGHGLIG